MTKILISTGFGAGWSTWIGSSDEETKFALTYGPLIEFIEAGGSLSNAGGTRFASDGNTPIFDGVKPDVLRQFAVEYYEKFNDVPYLGGAYSLEVVEVNGPFRVDEYDGSESVTTASDLMEL